MLIDSHCHLDADEFDGQSLAQAQAAAQLGVSGMVIPAVSVNNWARVRDLAHQLPGVGYAVGIHPMYVRYAQDSDIDKLDAFLATHANDSKLVAVGEVGLDFFVPDINWGVAQQRQIAFYQAQIRLAKQYHLPLILHVRRSQDTLLKYLRQLRFTQGGIAHAFNGSEQQAQAFMQLGFCLGFGGTMTFERSLQIRRLAQRLPMQAMVLETDAPDMLPAWVPPKGINRPAYLPRIAHTLAQLRQITLDTVATQTSANVMRVLPKMRTIWGGAPVVAKG